MSTSSSEWAAIWDQWLLKEKQKMPANDNYAPGSISSLTIPGLDKPKYDFFPYSIPNYQAPKHVVASGHFLLLGPHHVEYLEASAKLGRLTVIVNNDEQVRLKGHYPYLSEKERLFIIRSLKGVARAVLSVDTDRSVSKTLRLIHELDSVSIVTNGGDCTQDNFREAEVCRELGITALFGVGGAEKKSSSSQLVRLIKEAN